MICSIEDCEKQVKMTFKKYQSVEKAEVLSKDEHQVISSELKKTGKSSVSDLTQQEKEDLASKVAES